MAGNPYVIDYSPINDALQAPVDMALNLSKLQAYQQKMREGEQSMALMKQQQAQNEQEFALKQEKLKQVQAETAPQAFSTIYTRLGLNPEKDKKAVEFLTAAAKPYLREIDGFDEPTISMAQVRQLQQDMDSGEMKRGLVTSRLADLNETLTTERDKEMAGAETDAEKIQQQQAMVNQLEQRQSAMLNGLDQLDHYKNRIAETYGDGVAQMVDAGKISMSELSQMKTLKEKEKEAYLNALHEDRMQEITARGAESRATKQTAPGKAAGGGGGSTASPTKVFAEMYEVDSNGRTVTASKTKDGKYIDGNGNVIQGVTAARKMKWGRRSGGFGGGSSPVPVTKQTAKSYLGL
jgi:hypothetical protein